VKIAEKVLRVCRHAAGREKEEEQMDEENSSRHGFIPERPGANLHQRGVQQKQKEISVGETPLCQSNSYQRIRKSEQSCDMCLVHIELSVGTLNDEIFDCPYGGCE
jgi:hypothetical protein